MSSTLGVMWGRLNRHRKATIVAGKSTVKAVEDQTTEPDTDGETSTSESVGEGPKRAPSGASGSVSLRRTANSTSTSSRPQNLRGSQRRRQTDGGGTASGLELSVLRAAQELEMPIPVPHEDFPERVQEGLETVENLASGSQPVFPAPRWIYLTGRPQNPQPQINRSQDLRFVFAADGASILIWGGKEATHVTRICLPVENGQSLKGQKLPLVSAAARRGWMGSELCVVQVAGGSKLVAVVVLFEGSGYKLLCFDEEGNHDPQRHYIEKTGCGRDIPANLSVSRDDKRIAVGRGAVVDVYCVADEGLVETPGITPACSQTPASASGQDESLHSPCVATTHPHTPAVKVPRKFGRPSSQITNFSVDNTVLVVASQVRGNHFTRPKVRTSIHKITPDGLESLDSPDHYQLHVVSSNYILTAPGISGVFWLGQLPLLLTAQSPSSGATLLGSGDSRKNIVIVRDKLILAAAQGGMKGRESFVVFQCESGQIWLLDAQIWGDCRPLNSLSGNRVDLGTSDLKALSVLGEGIAEALWCSSKGTLLLEHIPMNGQGQAREVEGIGELYSNIQAQG
jgi:hypothetical protein